MNIFKRSRSNPTPKPPPKRQFLKYLAFGTMLTLINVSSAAYFFQYGVLRSRDSNEKLQHTQNDIAKKLRQQRQMLLENGQRLKQLDLEIEYANSLNLTTMAELKKNIYTQGVLHVKPKDMQKVDSKLKEIFNVDEIAKIPKTFETVINT